MEQSLSSTNGDGHSGHFERRLISAAGAPPAAAPGAINSPFAMARSFAPPGFDFDAEVEPRADAGGTASAGPGSAEAASSPKRRGPKPGSRRKPKSEAPIANVPKRRGRPPGSGKKTSKAKSVPAPKPVAKAARKAPRKTAVKASSKVGRKPRSLALVPAAPGPITAAAAPPPSLTCGLFNTGELRIEAGDQVMRLDRVQTRDLVAYLDKLSTAMEGA